jgi:hypothetical protein
MYLDENVFGGRDVDLQSTGLVQRRIKQGQKALIAVICVRIVWQVADDAHSLLT